MSLWDNGAAPRRALCLYWYCRARLGGGTIHGGAGEATLKRLEWSRSAYYRNVEAMRAHGLLTTDQWGNHRLLRSEDFIMLGNKSRPRHKSTLMLGPDATMKRVRSTIAAKFVERRLQQLTKRTKREALIVIDRRKRSSRTWYAGSRNDGFAQMSTRQLSKAIGMSRSWTVRWKRGAKEFFDIEDRRDVIPFAGRMKERPKLITYFDKRGNGIIIHPSALRPRLPYHPLSREQLTCS